MFLIDEEFKEKVKVGFGIDLDNNTFKSNNEEMTRKCIDFFKQGKFKTFNDFFEKLEKEPTYANSFVSEMTTNVTGFFRFPDWQVLEKYIDSKKKTIKLWSAACSTGQEPYSLAMWLLETYPRCKVEILATDIDNKVLSKAKSGVYTKEELKNCPVEWISKYFTRKNNVYIANKKLRNCINFKRHNLLSDDFEKGFDLIFCRNVLLYFSKESVEEVFSKVHSSLNEGGFFAIGDSELAVLMVNNFKMSNFKFDSLEPFFYKRK